MTRKLSAWNLFVQKIFKEGKAKDSNYEFKQALQDASDRKAEMEHHTPAASGVKKSMKKSAKRRGKGRGRRTRRRNRQ